MFEHNFGMSVTDTGHVSNRHSVCWRQRASTVGLHESAKISLNQV